MYSQAEAISDCISGSWNRTIGWCSGKNKTKAIEGPNIDAGADAFNKLNGGNETADVKSHDAGSQNVV